jgi:hypothetical protein
MIFWVLFGYGVGQICGWKYSSSSNAVIRGLSSLHQFNAETYYRQGPAGPVLIANALSPRELEEYTDCVMSSHGSTVVDLQHQLVDKGVTNLYESTLLQATDAILLASQSNSAYLAFCENLLLCDEMASGGGRRSMIHQLPTKARESLFPDDPDWFTSYFPKHYQPNDAIIMAGIGATSTLHRDPFAWLGTNLCLEGSKVWRMIHPNKSNDDGLDAYRLESIAWGADEKEGRSLSAGWQSDKSLFRKRQHDKLPRGKDLVGLSQHEKIQWITQISHNLDLLAPDDSIPDSVTFTTMIQQEGDLLLIPADWWHQTMALEPSVAIASQRCGKFEAPHVLKHMLDWNNKDASDVEQLLQSLTPQEAVDTVLNRIEQ